MKNTILFLLIFPSTVLAVDGYKDLKFGTSYAQLKKLKKCDLEEQKEFTTKSLRIYQCEDFDFNGKKMLATFHFVNDRLLKITIAVGRSLDENFALTKALKEKYGEFTHKPTHEEVLDYQSGLQESLYASWEKETVVLAIYRSGPNREIVFLSYVSPDFKNERQTTLIKDFKDEL